MAEQRPLSFVEAIDLLVELGADATLDYLLLEAYLMCHDCLKPMTLCPHGRGRRFWVVDRSGAIHVIE